MTLVARAEPERVSDPAANVPAGPESLVIAKVSPPRLRDGIVTRSDLVARLVAAASAPVVVVSAPAGYGKTTLLSDWALRDRRPFAWVTIDRRDNDPVVLIATIAAALRRVVAVDAAVDTTLRAPGLPLPRLVAGLVGALRSPEPFVLVLDDLDHLVSAAGREAINLLVEILPAGSQLALAARAEPWLASARRRALGHLVEIGASDLTLDVDEARLLLRAAGAEVGAPDAAALNAHTEGWATGLYLAALELRRACPPDVAGYLAEPNHRFVADYLHEEVLGGLAPAVADFVSRTAILDTMCGSLCDHVLATTGASEVLDELASSNLFLVPLDHHRGWYRYHPLLRELLVEALDRERAAETPALHARASDWFESHDMVSAAVDHAFLAGDHGRVATLVARHTVPFFAHGRLATIESWVERLGPDLVETYPPLAVLVSWIFTISGQAADGLRWAAVAERLTFEGPTVYGTASLESARCMVRSLHGARGLAAMVADAQRAVDEEPVWSPWRPTALRLLADARWAAGDQRTAEALLDECAELASGTASSWVLSLALAQRAMIAIARDDWDSARRDLDRATAVIDAEQLNDYVNSALAYAVKAQLALRDGLLPEARELLGRAMRLRSLATMATPLTALRLRVELARTYLKLADVDTTRLLMHEAGMILRQRPDLGLVADEVVELRDRLSAIPTAYQGASMLTAAELRLLPYLQTYLGFREIGERMFISRNTVSTQAASIYRKLAVTSRGGAVERARALGLLDG